MRGGRVGEGRVCDVDEDEEGGDDEGDPARDGLHGDDEGGPRDDDEERGGHVVVEHVGGRLAAQQHREARVGDLMMTREKV